ncbi:MAG: hypothetical protein ACRELY_19365, partial [Polyangiaceae bacterium]
MRAAVSAMLLAAFGAACLSTSGLDDGTRPACNADLQTDVANCGACGNACGSAANAAVTCAAGKCTSTCNAGSIDCNKDPSDGCEATLAGDPKNCSACGRDCLGGACNGSVCQPITIQSVTGQPSGIAVDDSGVYFGLNPPGGTTSEVVRIAKDGSGAQPLVLNRSNVSAIAIDDTFVYWVEVNGGANGRILKAPKDGSSGVPQTVATGLAVTASAQLVIDSPNAIWSAYGVDDGTGTGTLVGGGVYSCALAGCGSAPNVLASFEEVNGVAVSPPSIFFGIDALTPGPGAFDCPIGGCSGAPALVPGATAAAVQLAADSAGVTWTTSAGVARYSGTSLTMVASGLAGLHAVVTDNTNVYFTSISGGSVYACPVAGCTGAPIIMASGLTSPAYIAADVTAIYVSSGSG